MELFSLIVNGKRCKLENNKKEKIWYVQLYLPENKYLCVDQDTSDDRYHLCYCGTKEKCEQYFRMKTIQVEGYCGSPMGCGAFRNDSTVVAKAWHATVKSYDGYFENIEFAVYCKDYETVNYDAFKKEMYSL